MTGLRAQFRRAIAAPLLFLVLAPPAPGGTLVLDIDPSPQNQRNSEGAFATLADGRLWFCYTQFYGGTGDHHPARIVGIESRDQGRTWSDPRVVIESVMLTPSSDMLTPVMSRLSKPLSNRSFDASV